MEPQPSPILLYDIDGTLLKARREFLFGVIKDLLQKYHIEFPPQKNSTFAGRTDRGIFMELIGNSPDSHKLFPEIQNRYSEMMVNMLEVHHMDIFNDAIKSVRDVVQMGFPVGLCTGNFRAVALKKVETAGLGNIFKFGGFGEISSDRNHLPQEADRAYRELYKETPHPGRYVIIGDTPNDIRCAKFFGARSVAVTTGGFGPEELNKHNPDIILDSLEHPRQWLSKLGFD